MTRLRLMVARPFRPLTRVLTPATAARRRPGRFRPLALVFRRARTRRPMAPTPALVAKDGTRVTIAPRLQWHLHLHQHLHQQVYLRGQQPSSDRVNAAARRGAATPSARAGWALRLARAGRAVGGPRAAPEAWLVLASSSSTIDAVEPPRRATPRTSRVQVTIHRRTFGRSPGPGPHAARGGTSRPMLLSPHPDRGRAVPPPALTLVSASVPIASRRAHRARPVLGLRWSGTDGPRTSSRTGSPRASTAVQALATRRRDPERPVSPASITFRRTADARLDRVAQPPARAVSAPPPPVRADIDRISDEVIRRIERRSRIERERRGLL